MQVLYESLFNYHIKKICGFKKNFPTKYNISILRESLENLSL